MAVHQHRFDAIGCQHAVVTTDATMLAAAATIAQPTVAELDRVASRFRPDSELGHLTTNAAGRPVHAVVSPLLGSCLDAALYAADITDGLVDPTVGAAVAASGYDADQAQVRARGSLGHGAGIARPVPVPGWRTVSYDPRTRLLTLPRGTALELGATAKAHAAVLVADRLARELRGGFLVNLGGDIAVSGLLPSAAGTSVSRTSAGRCGRWSSVPDKPWPGRRRDCELG